MEKLKNKDILQLFSNPKIVSDGIKAAKSKAKKDSVDVRIYKMERAIDALRSTIFHGDCIGSEQDYNLASYRKSLEIQQTLVSKIDFLLTGQEQSFSGDYEESTQAPEVTEKLINSVNEWLDHCGSSAGSQRMISSIFVSCLVDRTASDLH